MFRLYGIPNCDTVKKARVFLDKKKIAYTFVDFKKTPPTEADLTRWSGFAGEEFINRKGTTFKKHKETFEGLKGKARDKFIIENSSLLKRPILEKNGKVLFVGFNNDEYEKLLL